MFGLTPITILYDKRILPTAKILFTILQVNADVKGEVLLNMKDLQEKLQGIVNGQLVNLSETAIQKELKSLADLKYISITDNVIKVNLYPQEEKKVEVVQKQIITQEPPRKNSMEKRRDKYATEIEEVIVYVKECLVIRGYSNENVNLNTTPHKNTILYALEANYSVKDLIALTNYYFSNDFYTERKENLVPSRMFKLAKVHEIVPTIKDDSPFRNMKINVMGQEQETRAVERVEDVF